MPDKQLPQTVNAAVPRSGYSDGELDPLSLSEILGIYLRWWRVSLITFFGLLIPAVVVIFLILPLYEGHGELWVHRDSPQSNFSIQSGPAGGTIFRNVNREEEVSTSAEMIKARSIAEDIVGDLDLSMDKLNYIHDARRYVQMVIYGAIDTAKWLYDGLKSLLHLGKPLTEEEKRELGHIRLVDEVIDRIEVTPVTESNILRVTFRSSDPIIARDIVNLLLDKYIVFHGSMREDRAHSFFTDSAERLRGELETAEKALLKLQVESSNFVSLHQQDSLVAHYEAAKEKLRVLGVQHAKLNAQIESLRKHLAEVPDTVLVQQKGIGNSKQGIVWGINPVHQELKVQLISSETALFASEQEERATRELLAEYSQELDTKGVVNMEIREHQRRVKLLEEAYEMNVRNLEEARVGQAMSSASLSSVRVVSYAPLPLKTIRPRKLFYLLIAFGASLLVALAMPFLAFLNDSTIADEADVHKYLGIEFVSSFPKYDKKLLGKA